MFCSCFFFCQSLGDRNHRQTFNVAASRMARNQACSKSHERLVHSLLRTRVPTSPRHIDAYERLTPSLRLSTVRLLYLHPPNGTLCSGHRDSLIYINSSCTLYFIHPSPTSMSSLFFLLFFLSPAIHFLPCLFFFFSFSFFLLFPFLSIFFISPFFISLSSSFFFFSPSLRSLRMPLLLRHLPPVNSSSLTQIHRRLLSLVDPPAAPFQLRRAPLLLTRGCVEPNPSGRASPAPRATAWN